MDNITKTLNLDLQLLNSLVHKKMLILIKGKLDSKLPDSVGELSELIGKFKGLCQDYLEGNLKKLRKVSFKKITKVVKVVKKLQKKVYNNKLKFNQ